MTHRCMLHMSKRWFRLLERLYPHHFRDEMGNAVVEAYMDRAPPLAAQRREDPSRGTLVSRADRLASQWPCRAGAPSGLVAARRQLGTRALPLSTPRPSILYRGFARGLSHTIEVDSGRMIPRVEKVSAVTFQVTNMQVTVQFYRDVLGMELLYGGEDSHFSSLRAREKSLQSSICKRAIPQSVGVD